ncbi:MAG: polysaccharide pyruvyl transferase family protein [Bryobacteraceae bacterium]
MDATLRRPKKIGLLNHMGAGNLGDDATQTVVIQHIRRHWPNSEIYGFSMNPSDTQARQGIPSYPIRHQTWDIGNYTNVSKTTISKATFKDNVKTAAGEHQVILGALKVLNTLAVKMPRALFQEVPFLARSFHTLRRFDLLIISGGGQLLDSWGGVWKFPYTIFKWVLLAKLSRVPCYFINVGAGPLDHPVAKWLVRRAVLLANYVSFRDEYSKALIEQIGFTGASEVVADCVYGLEIRLPNTSRHRTQRNPIVGFSPMAYCDPRVYFDKDQTRYADFLQKMVTFGSWLSRKHYSLVLFSTDIYFDSWAIDDFDVALRNNEYSAEPNLVKPTSIQTTESLLAQMSTMDYIVTCRYHGVIFAHVMNIPVVAVAHHPKVATVMNDFGLSEYCLDIGAFDSDALIETFTRMVNNTHGIKAKMAEGVALRKRELSRQLDALFSRGPVRN